MATQPHTVTQSSALSICNATQQPGAFKSGMQNAGFEFSVPVKDESTIYYFCGVPSHCQKGMVRESLPRSTRDTCKTCLLTAESDAFAVWPDQRALAPLRPRLEDHCELTRLLPFLLAGCRRRPPERQLRQLPRPVGSHVSQLALFPSLVRVRRRSRRNGY